jgi:hypothetical protein
LPNFENFSKSNLATKFLKVEYQRQENGLKTGPDVEAPGRVREGDTKLVR